MKTLLIGSGGREHALAWKISQSPHCEKLWCAPGNAGIAECAECVDIAVDNLDALVRFAKEKAVDFTIIGPETPLVLGLADLLRAEGIAVFGPSRAAAQLEGSKAFMKDLCAKYGIPTAAHGTFSDIKDARAFIEKTGAPIVVKADGLAAGKGVIIAQSEKEALAAAEEMLSGQSFGKAGHKVIIEEFLEGEEISFFALTDGATTLPLLSAQDHKRVGEGDTGLNTGGMGAYAPAPARIMTPELTAKIMEDIILPTVQGMEKEGSPFSGVLFAGLMVKDGKPRLLEYNARFGDPECQTLMTLFDGDLLPILYACTQGRLADAQHDILWKPGAALCVVMASHGYPETYLNNTVIHGLDKAGHIENARIFHAGTAKDDKGRIVSNGGRVLGVTAYGTTVAEAQERAYKAVDAIDWPEGFCRRDIGWRAA